MALSKSKSKEKPFHNLIIGVQMALYSGSATIPELKPECDAWMTEKYQVPVTAQKMTVGRFVWKAATDCQEFNQKVQPLQTEET